MKEKMAEKVLRFYLGMYTYGYELYPKYARDTGCVFEVKEYCPDGAVQGVYSLTVDDKYRVLRGTQDIVQEKWAILEPENFDERIDLERLERLRTKAWFLDVMERYAKETMNLMDAYDAVCDADEDFPNSFAEEYPLDRSFEEVLGDVISWKEHQLKKIKEEYGI